MSGWFSLEAVYAKKGDALILHYGLKNSPRWILIDGGHNQVYDNYLRPRLEELRFQWPNRLDKNNQLKFEMVMISHADADHIQGILDLTSHMMNQHDVGIPEVPINFDNIWFNGFEDIIAGTYKSSSTAALASVASMVETDTYNNNGLPNTLAKDNPMRAVVASTRQGRQLLSVLDALIIERNKEFSGELIMQDDSNSKIIKYRPGLSIQIIGPSKKRVEKLQNKWKKDLKEILTSKSSANATSFDDGSPFNLSSIMVLVKRHGKSMLLTGDARGDDLIYGLKQEDLLNNDSKIHVDLFKLPHHGSDRNVKEETFRDITANHYVISANGEHSNPETTTLDMLVAGRAQTKTDKYTVYLTFPYEAFKLIDEDQANQKKKVRDQKNALEKIDKWIKESKPNNMDVIYREESEFSVSVNLGDEQIN